MNCKGPFREISSQICPCFDIVFAQLGVIPGTRNKFVEMVAAAVSYLSITHVKNKESKKRPFHRPWHIPIPKLYLS